MEVNFQLIIIRQQKGIYIDLPLTEHIIGCQYLFFVQVDIRIGIQSFEYESDSLFLHDFCRERKSGFIDPVFFVDPLQPSFVEPEERIFNDFISQQIGMYQKETPAQRILQLQEALNKIHGRILSAAAQMQKNEMDKLHLETEQQRLELLRIRATGEIGEPGDGDKDAVHE